MTNLHICDSSGMANPESLTFFIDHPELQLPEPALSPRTQLPAQINGTIEGMAFAKGTAP